MKKFEREIFLSICFDIEKAKDKIAAIKRIYSKIERIKEDEK